MTASENRKNRIITAVAVLLLLGYFAAFCIINFGGFTSFLTADMYSDMLAARYIWESKSLFPENWVFGNQYYVVATPVLTALFYGITGSMNLSMALATTAMTIFLFIAVYTAVSDYLPTHRCFFAILALTAGVIAVDVRYKPEAQIFFVMASYYVCYLITAFVVFGDYVKCLISGKNLLCSSFIIGLALCFCTGMQSVRQMGVMILPLLAFECLRILYALMRKQKRNRELWMPTLRAALYAVSNVLGMLLIKLLNVPTHTIYGEAIFASPDEWVANIITVLRSLRSITGLSYITEHENGWIVAVLAVFSILCVLAALIKIAAAKKFGAIECFVLLFFLSLVVLSFVGVFTGIKVRTIYFFMWYPLLALSQVYLASALKCRKSAVFTCLALILCLVNLFYSYMPAVRVSLKDKPETSETLAAEWLTENDYEIVYSHFWPASMIAAETDGRVIGAGWNESMFKALSYINATDLYSADKIEKAAYYIYDGDLPYANEYAESLGAELYKLTDLGDYGLYGSDKQLMYMGND